MCEKRLQGDELDVVGSVYHKEWLGLTGIGSSESELGASGEGAAVGAISRGFDIVVRLEECSSSDDQSETERSM